MRRLKFVARLQFEMDWRESVIDYCERLDGRFWAEPLNALSNAAFLLAAAAIFRLLRQQKAQDPPVVALTLVTAAVGVGSFLFHTLATRGAMLLDVIPIAVFIYGYFFLALRRYFGLAALASAAITAAFAAASFFVEAHFRGLNGSIAYLPALAALVVFALLLGRGRDMRKVAIGLAAASATFFVSLVFRTIDRNVCPAFPVGTHFVWHLLNACVLWLLLRAALMGNTRGAPQARPSQNAKVPTAA